MNKMPVNVVFSKIADPVYERMQAPIKFYSIERGYGFLKAASKNDKDIFFTSKSLEKAKIHVNTIKENDILSFDFMPIEGKGGKAVNLKKVDK